MSQNPKGSRLSPVKSVSVDPTIDSVPRYLQFVTGLVCLLYFSRFFLPAESAVLGETLWIATLWIACLLLWAAGMGRWGAARFRFDSIDAMIGLWIGGQVISAAVVVMTTGEKRSAVNLAWESISVGITWFIMRQGLVWPAVRRGILQAMIVTGTLLGTYGLYQHYVEIPEMVALYGPLFDRLRTATGSEADAIRQELSRDGIPTEGPALILYEKRLRDSREPVGLFALANTFGGCLAVCVILGVGQIVECRQAGTRWNRLIGWGVASGVIGWCLLLTKSRTAWIGVMVGLTILMASRLRFWQTRRRVLIGIAVGGLAIVAVTSALFLFGGLDRQVISEAPKSLAYRLQYWQATMRLIGDHPWLGVGPGNFRQHYLHYKLPEASEEIADPHNLFFDVAATGGLVSFLGLILFLGSILITSLREFRTQESIPNVPGDSDQRNHFPSIPYWISGGGLLTVFAAQLLCWGEWDDRLLILTAVWFILAVMIRLPARFGLACAVDGSVAIPSLAAGFALATHLLGAGGIAMPGVSQVLVTLFAFSLPSRPEISSPSFLIKRRGLIIGGLGLALFVGIVVTGLLPVLKCRTLLAQGRQLAGANDSRLREQAASFFQAAATADPWSPEPWRYLYEWNSGTGIQSNESFSTSVQELQEVVRRDPQNFWAPRTLGAVWLQKWQKSRSDSDGDEAVRWLRRALILYPTNSRIRADLAFALESVNDLQKARIAAQEALNQDEIYRQHGHIDRYLDDSLRQRLVTLVDRR